MVQVKVDELSRKIDNIMLKIENGESCVIIKEGLPIAEILPVAKKAKGWKRSIKKISLPEGVSTQPYIEQERDL